MVFFPSSLPAEGEAAITLLQSFLAGITGRAFLAHKYIFLVPTKQFNIFSHKSPYVW